MPWHKGVRLTPASWGRWAATLTALTHRGRHRATRTAGAYGWRRWTAPLPAHAHCNRHHVAAAATISAARAPKAGPALSQSALSQSALTKPAVG